MPLSPLNLPFASQRHFRVLLSDAPAARSQLTQEIWDHLAFLEAKERSREFIDLTTARRVARVCEELLARIDDSADDAHRLVQAVIRYFVLTSDAEDDLESPIGFDDDLAVACEVAHHLGHHDLATLGE